MILATFYAGRRGGIVSTSGLLKNYGDLLIFR